MTKKRNCEIAKEIGIYIKDARERAYMSQRDLAAAVGVSGAAVHFWETGANSPDAENIRQICLAMKISADRLLHLPAAFADICVPMAGETSCP